MVGEIFVSKKAVKNLIKKENERLRVKKLALDLIEDILKEIAEEIAKECNKTCSYLNTKIIDESVVRYSYPRALYNIVRRIAEKKVDESFQVDFREFVKELEYWLLK